MSIGSDIRDQTGRLENFSRAAPKSLSSDAIPYILSTADAVIILISSLLGGIGYQLLAGYSVPNLTAYCAIGFLAGLLHGLRMKGRGYYALPDCAKAHVETGGILVCWFTTGLLLAFIAFLLKVSVDFSRGAFVTFYFLAPIGLLGVRKLTKKALVEAISRGAIGRHDSVLVGAFNEFGVVEAKDLL